MNPSHRKVKAKSAKEAAKVERQMTTNLIEKAREQEVQARERAEALRRFIYMAEELGLTNGNGTTREETPAKANSRTEQIARARQMRQSLRSLFRSTSTQLTNTDIYKALEPHFGRHYKNPSSFNASVDSQLRRLAVVRKVGRTWRLR